MKTNHSFLLEKLPLMENFSFFEKSLMSKEHLLNFILVIAVIFLSKKISLQKLKDNYLKILKENLKSNNHTNEKTDSNF